MKPGACNIASVEDASAAILRYRRLAGWDYSKGASLFMTLTTEPRRPLFGSVCGDKVALSPLGTEVMASLEAIPRFCPAITIFGHVVMPDHVHFNCHLAAGLQEPLKVLGQAIRSFKNHTTKVYRLNAVQPSPLPFPSEADRTVFGQPAPPSADGRTMFGQVPAPKVQMAERRSAKLWHQGYHDHLCLSREFIESTERYIAYNPRKWALMHGAGHLRVQEPLASSRLDPAAYWKGVGNLALLGADMRLVSLRVSMKVVDVAPVVARMECAVDRGFVVVSGFVSKGERAVLDMLCSRGDARFIRVRTSCIPNKRYKPESAYVAPFAEGRFLDLGKGNDEVEFSRGACLDVNREIVAIATAAPGLAVYFTKDGLRKLAEHTPK